MPDKQLVEFMELEDGRIERQPATLIQGLEYIERMMYAQVRLPVTSESDTQGLLWWHRDLIAALKNLPSSVNVPKAGTGETVKLKDAIDAMVLAKKNANRRARYVDSLEHYLRHFARGREDRLINSISNEDVENWMNKYPNAWTRHTLLNRFSTLFAFSVKQGWIPSNPCDRIERVSVTREAPKILTIKQSRQALEYVREKIPDFVPWFTLAHFIGVRPEECDKITWPAISLDRKILTIDAAGAKTRRRRIVPLPPVAIEWLKLGGELPFKPRTREWYIRLLRRHLGFAKWPKDILRHTAASMMLAKEQDAAKVALWLGNSEKILHAHYRQLVAKETAEEFWNIRPTRHIVFKF